MEIGEGERGRREREIETEGVRNGKDDRRVKEAKER